MKEIYPAFSEEINFYAIGQSQFENLEKLEEYSRKEDYPWPVAEIDPKILKKLRGLQQSTKIGLDHQGVITYRSGYGDGDPKTWQQVFADLAIGMGSLSLSGSSSD